MSTEDRVAGLLEELVAWTRFANRTSLIAVWRVVLAEPKHFVAYELSDGQLSQKEVGDKAELSQPTISTLWIKWRRLGLARDVGGRTRHLARPSDYGIQPPGPPKNEATRKEG
jgi:hypothetical protein